MGLGGHGAEQLGVLVVEPKGFVAARLQEYLEGLGHRVLGRARDGREAIEAAQRLQPDLILMETALPGLDAVSAVRAIVNAQPVPVILVASYAGADLVRQAREAGVVAYLTSVDRKRLGSAIDVALKRFGESRILRREESDASEALATRKRLELAKKLLIRRLRLSEAEAFQHILERRLSTGWTLGQTAWTIIEAEDMISRIDLVGSLQLIVDVIRLDRRPSGPAERDRLEALSR